jgi:hypothetical protein
MVNGSGLLLHAVGRLIFDSDLSKTPSWVMDSTWEGSTTVVYTAVWRDSLV